MNVQAGWFKPCPGGQRLILMKGSGVLEQIRLCPGGESITNYGVLGMLSFF